MKSCILFCRVSTSKQDWERQRSSLLEMAHKEGYTDDRIITIGNHESGYKLLLEERKGLQDLLRLIDGGNIDCVFVWELSRLARKPKILYEIRDMLSERGIQLICETPSFKLLQKDLKSIDPVANIVFGIFAALAEQEQFLRKVRFEDGKSKNAAKQRYNGGNIPYGYKIKEDKSFEIDDDQADVIRTIFNLYEAGYSTKNIVKELRTLYNNLHPTLSFVHNILNSELLTGRSHDEKVVESIVHGEKRMWHSYARSYPQIITERQYDRCREIAASNNTNVSKAKNIYFARKILRCSECGGYMNGVANRGYYKCFDAWDANRELNGRPEDTRCKNKSTISINVIDSILWDAAVREETLSILVDKSDKIKEYKEQIEKTEKKIEVANGQIQNCNLRLKRAYEAYVDDDSDPSFAKSLYEEKKGKILKEKNEIISDIAKLKSEKEDLEELLKGIAENTKIKNLLNQINEAKKYSTPFPYKRMLEDSDEWQEISSTIYNNTNEEERGRLVARHISSATIQENFIPYELGDFTQKEGVSEPIYYRKVILSYVDGHKDSYVVRPTRSKGKHVFHYGEGHLEKLYPVPVIVRYRNKNQQKRRESEKEERAKREQERSMNFVSIRDIMAITGWNYGKIKYAINRKGLTAEKEGKNYYVSKKVWESWYKQHKDNTN